VLFNPKTVVDRSTFSEPAVLPIGIDKVFVGGELVWDAGKPTAARPGKIVMGRSFRPLGCLHPGQARDESLALRLSRRRASLSSPACGGCKQASLSDVKVGEATRNVTRLRCPFQRIQKLAPNSVVVWHTS